MLILCNFYKAGKLLPILWTDLKKAFTIQITNQKHTAKAEADLVRVHNESDAKKWNGICCPAF